VTEIPIYYILAEFIFYNTWLWVWL